MEFGISGKVVERRKLEKIPRFRSGTKAASRNCSRYPTGTQFSAPLRGTQFNPPPEEDKYLVGIGNYIFSKVFPGFLFVITAFTE